MCWQSQVWFQRAMVTVLAVELVIGRVHSSVSRAQNSPKCNASAGTVNMLPPPIYKSAIRMGCGFRYGDMPGCKHRSDGRKTTAHANSAHNGDRSFHGEFRIDTECEIS
jgi:hypothetical protein